MLIASGLCFFIGALFILTASIGVNRLPDLFTQMHAAAKAGTLGLTFVLLGVCLYFLELKIWSEALMTLIFIYISAPVAIHLLARSAYKNEAYFYEVDGVNDLALHYEGLAEAEPPLKSVEREKTMRTGSKQGGSFDDEQ